MKKIAFSYSLRYLCYYIAIIALWLKVITCNWENINNIYIKNYKDQAVEYQRSSSGIEGFVSDLSAEADAKYKIDPQLSRDCRQMALQYAGGARLQHLRASFLEDQAEKCEKSPFYWLFGGNLLGTSNIPHLPSIRSSSGWRKSWFTRASESVGVAIHQNPLLLMASSLDIKWFLCLILVLYYRKIWMLANFCRRSE